MPIPLFKGYLTFDEMIDEIKGVREVTEPLKKYLLDILIKYRCKTITDVKIAMGFKYFDSYGYLVNLENINIAGRIKIEFIDSWQQENFIIV